MAAAAAVQDRADVVGSNRMSSLAIHEQDRERSLALFMIAFGLGGRDLARLKTHFQVRASEADTVCGPPVCPPV